MFGYVTTRIELHQIGAADFIRALLHIINIVAEESGAHLSPGLVLIIH